jgi:hypothetical protein
MKTGREIPVPTDTVYHINRSHTVFAGKIGNGKLTPYFRKEWERNQLRNFPDRIHCSRIRAGKFPVLFPYFVHLNLIFSPLIDAAHETSRFPAPQAQPTPVRYSLPSVPKMATKPYPLSTSPRLGDSRPVRRRLHLSARARLPRCPWRLRADERCDIDIQQLLSFGFSHQLCILQGSTI